MDHLTILGDAVAFALVVDALAHPGPADPSRLPPLACLGTVMPGADPAAFAAVAARDLHDPGIPAELLTTSEPPLRPYATA